MKKAVFQSTRPRGARRDVLYYILLQLLISIHAPARGATYVIAFFLHLVIHFNPRAREGRDEE